MRARERAGQLRPASATCIFSGTSAVNTSIALMQCRLCRTFTLSRTRTVGREIESSSSLSLWTAAGMIATRIDANVSKTVGSTGPTTSSAAAIEVRRTVGSLSRSSSVSQANGRRSFAAHCAKSVVFPYPVGAMIDTSGMAREAWSRATNSVLGMMPLRRTDGRWSFVCVSPERLQASRGDSGRLTTVVA